MPSFLSHDGVPLVYHVIGEGQPLLVLSGGPMRASAYLGDLGGLSAHRALHLLDLRGTGDSGTPADPASYRCDRQVDDVEAFRKHLGLPSVDLLAHSAGANLAMLYAAAHPERIRKLALVTPSLRALGIDFVPAHLADAAAARTGEPWFAAVKPAVDALVDGTATEEHWNALTPLFYGRWDAAAQADAATDAKERNPELMARYYADGAFDPPATRAALAALTAPVLVLAGELDPGPRPSVAKEAAATFPNSETAVIPGAGHVAWLDDADFLVSTVTAFLD
jgi:pimeloyl-ACP methyl ester carboxylesterase